MRSLSWPWRFGCGVAVGMAIVAVDNLAFEGEVSPIVIVVPAACRHNDGRRHLGSAWLDRLRCNMGLRAARNLVKHLLGLPDTLHPNTYTSILMLGAFTFVVAALGTSCGMLVFRNTTGRSNQNHHT